MGGKVQLDVPRLAYRIKPDFICVSVCYTHTHTLVAWHHVSQGKTKKSTSGATRSPQHTMHAAHENAWMCTSQQHSQLWISIEIHSNWRCFLLCYICFSFLRARRGNTTVSNRTRRKEKEKALTFPWSVTLWQFTPDKWLFEWLNTVIFPSFWGLNHWQEQTDGQKISVMLT